MQFYDFFHHSTKRFSEDAVPALEPSAWPKEWTTTYVKKYERFPSFPLSDPKSVDADLFNVIVNRRSRREFNNNISAEILSTLLFYALGETDKKSRGGAGLRTYPSGGARYPTECYVILFEQIDALVPAVYHYDVDAHSLSLIYNKRVRGEILRSMNKYEFIQKSKFAILLTGVMFRLLTKYTDQSYRLALLEVGGIAQNLSLVSTALEIDSVNIGILSADIVEELLDIDGTDEIYIHSIFFG